jgi:1-acyl-sn-glycerol-3-phosphate acyltransferase
MDFWYSFVTTVIRFYTTFFLQYHVEGREHIPAGPKIIVGNHPYATDGFVLPQIFKEQLHFAIQANVFDIPILGRLLTLAGQIPVKVGEGQEMLKSAIEWLEKGQDIVIFPEGRLNFGKDMHRAGSGAALLALQTGAPVVPLGIWTPPEFTPTSRGGLLKRPAAESWQMGGRLYIKIGEPLLLPKPADPSRLHRHLRECTSQIMNSISELVVQIQK